MTRKKWADLREEHLAKLSPEGRARYEAKKKQFEDELQQMREFVERGERAQAAVNEIIDNHEKGK